MKPTCLALDFDHTLAHFAGYDGMFDIFVRQGVPLPLVRESYQKSLRSIGSMISFLTEKTDVKLDAPKIYREFDEWLSANLLIYPDAKRFLEKQDLPIAIVTLGDAPHQEQKIKKLGFKYDHFMPVANINKKSDQIKILLDKYGAPIIFVDNKNSELDSVRARFKESQVITYLIDREENPYSHQKPKFKHIIITTLNELPI